MIHPRMLHLLSRYATSDVSCTCHGGSSMCYIIRNRLPVPVLLAYDGRGGYAGYRGYEVPSGMEERRVLYQYSRDKHPRRN